MNQNSPSERGSEDTGCGMGIGSVFGDSRVLCETCWVCGCFLKLGPLGAEAARCISWVFGEDSLGKDGDL